MAESASRRSWRDHPLVQLTLCRFREFYREPEAIFWTFLFPILMAAGLGLAFRNKPPEVVKVGVVDRGAPTTEVMSRLAGNALLGVERLTDSAGMWALRTGKIAVLVVPEAGGGVEYRFDPSRPEAASGRRIADDALQRGSGRTDPVPVTESPVQERGARYIDFLVPGLLGMNLMATGLWGIGFTLVDQRRKKLLKRLIATPMSKAHYLASFVLSRLSMLVLEVSVLLAFAVWVFDVPIRGSLALVYGITFLGSLGFGALGLLIAARPRTVEGASGLMNVAMLPMWVFSGVFFASSNFPDAMQPFIQALPLTAVNDALRATMLEGAGLAQVAPELVIVVVWLVACFVTALKIFRWQ